MADTFLRDYRLCAFIDNATGKFLGKSVGSRMREARNDFYRRDSARGSALLYARCCENEETQIFPQSANPAFRHDICRTTELAIREHHGERELTKLDPVQISRVAEIEFSPSRCTVL